MLVEDVARVVGALPRKVRTVLEEKGSEVCVAGGFVRAVVAGERPSDVDLFVPSPTKAVELREALVGEDGHFFETPFAYSATIGGQLVQVIHRWTFCGAEEILASFDFSVARAAVWSYGPGSWDGAVSENFYRDLASKRLRYMLADERRLDIEAGGTLLRTAKYLRRGYSISPEDLAKVALHASHAAGANPSGEVYHYPVDRLLHENLVRSLRGVDPRRPWE